MPRCTGRLGVRGGEYLLRFDPVKTVTATAELAVHIDFAAFGNDRAHFVEPYHPQHARHPLARTGSAKTHRLRAKDAHVIGGIEAPQDVTSVEGRKLARRQRVG